MTFDATNPLTNNSVLLSAVVQPGDLSCPVCGVSYSHHRSLFEHMKKHRGETRCPVCGQEFARKLNMRQHMVARHGMSRQEVDRVTNKRLTAADYSARVGGRLVAPGEATRAYDVFDAVQHYREGS